MSIFLRYSIDTSIALLAAVGVVELALFVFGGFLTDSTDESAQDDAD